MSRTNFQNLTDPKVQSIVTKANKNEKTLFQRTIEKRENEFTVKRERKTLELRSKFGRPFGPIKERKRLISENHLSSPYFAIFLSAIC
jgi:hypothetical protein